MNRWPTFLMALLLASGMIACTGDGPDEQGTGGDGDGAFALTNTTHYNPEGLLRGQGLKIFTELRAVDLEGGGTYDVEVRNDNTQEVLSIGNLYVDISQNIRPYPLMFDVGLYAEVEEGDNIRVTLSDDEGLSLSEIISLSALRLPGWDVAEVAAPEVYVTDQSGQPANAFAVGGQDPGEVAGEVHVAGRGFPEALWGRTVDVYIVEARDDWMSQLIPQEGEAGHVFGPVAVQLDAQGNLPTTGLGFLPTEAHLGPLDLLADTDGNGRMDWSLGVKDGGDGVDEQVGFTVQYSQAWIRARGQRHILVNIAYNSGARGDGQWANTFRPGDDIFTYLNPPVMHQYHFGVTKWIVHHRDFDAFWNNQALETTDAEGNACIPFSELAAQHMGVPIQRGCTNTGPVFWGPAAMVIDPETGTESETFDVVFDRNGDGCYAPGVDLLDVVGSADHSGGLVSFEDFEAMSPEEQVGFRVVE
jgi:hypothetical protein